MSCKAYPKWTANLRLRSNISNSTKKFLQFTDFAIKENPTVYGLGFSDENKTNECKMIIENLKSTLTELRKSKKAEKLTSVPTKTEKSIVPSIDKNENKENQNRPLNKTIPSSMKFCGVENVKNEVMNDIMLDKEREMLNDDLADENRATAENWQKENDKMSKQIKEKDSIIEQQRLEIADY